AGTRAVYLHAARGATGTMAVERKRVPRSPGARAGRSARAGDAEPHRRAFAAAAAQGLRAAGGARILPVSGAFPPAAQILPLTLRAHRPARAGTGPGGI